MVGFRQIDGAQQVGGLWRIYTVSETARNMLLIQGFIRRGVRVNVLAQNTFIVRRNDGYEEKMKHTKLIIGGVPY